MGVLVLFCEELPRACENSEIQFEVVFVWRLLDQQSPFLVGVESGGKTSAHDYAVCRLTWIGSEERFDELLKWPL